MSTVAIDAREYSTSTGRYISSLVNYLQQLPDDQNTYKILLKPQDMAKVQLTNPRFTAIECPYKEFSFAEQLGYARQLYGLRIDLVHFGMTQQPVLYRRPSVTTIHDLTTVRFTNPDTNLIVFKLKQQIYKIVTRFVARKSRQLITPTDFVKRDIVSYAHVDPGKVTVTLESADPITDDAEPIKELAGKQFIMYVGRPTPHKNLGRLIEAFHELQHQYPDLVLVLAGKLDNNYRTIQQKVQNEQIANITFTDFVSEGQLRWLYEHCAAYVFPSLSEGFGLPGLEAMSHGAPVVSSNTTCLPEVYGEAAHYFDPTDVQAIANAIDEVITDHTLRDRLIDAGRRQVGKYSWRRMAEQTVTVYERALKP